MRLPLRLRALLGVASLATFAACGGGGGGSPTPASPGATQAPSTAAPVTNPSGPASAIASATASPSTVVTPSAAPAAVTMAPPSTPPDAPGITNTVPASPTGTTCRAGQIYNISILSPIGDTVGFTVFEPATICGGQTYPLVLQAPGFGGQRQQTLSAPAPSATGGLNVGNNLSELVAANYGVISFDQRGMGGGTSGTIRTMDSDFEGKDYLSIMDWAQTKLGWLAFGPTLDGADSHEPILGSIGGSYGGMYQFMLLNIDKRHRLRAIVPNITPNDLNFSLFPGGAVKTVWDDFLFGDGTALAGEGTSRAQFDPYQEQITTSTIETNAENQGAQDFFGYHSVDYFCNGATIATNGGPGTSPQLPPTTKMPMVNAMVWIGVRDTLFNFNNGYRNYACLQRAGGDVRLLSYQSGHNSPIENGTEVGVTQDPGVVAYYPSGDNVDSRCGSTLTEDAAQLAWFNQYLKMQAGAASGIPTGPCISLSEGDAVTLPAVPTFTSGAAETPYTLGSIPVVAGSNVDVPSTVTLYTAGAQGDVELGIPHAQITVAGVAGVAVTSPIIYIGLGIKHVSNPAVLELIDNNVLPIRGTGYFDVDMIGGGARLQPGDQLEFLVYGLHDQYAANGNVSAPTPSVVPLTVSGTVYIPDIGPMASNF